MYGGKFAFQNQLGQLVMARKFTIFPLFYFVFEGKFQVQAPRGRLIFGAGAIEQRVFCVTILRGLIFGEAYTWRSLFAEFYGIFKPREAAYQSVFHVMNNMRVAESERRNLNLKKSSSLVLVGQTIYSHSKTRKFILKQCRQCVQQSIHLLINFQVFKQQFLVQYWID